MTERVNPSSTGASGRTSRREGLTAAKRDLLARWVSGEAGQPSEAAIPRRDPRAEVPLSFAQQRIWFIHQLEPESPAYNISAAFHLAGRLDRGALLAAFNAVIGRHEVLRTRFGECGGSPVQMVLAEERALLPVIDLTGLPLEPRTMKMRDLAREEARRPLDLARGPLLRLGLLALAAEEHVLLLTISHAIADGWSIGLLIHEVTAFYGEFLGGPKAAVPALPVQYADFAVWQRRQFQGERLQKEIAFWRSQLAGAPSLLELPADRPRPPLQTFRGASRSFSIRPESLEGLRAACRGSSATLFMGLLAGFSALLHRYAGQEEIVAGSPVANRRRLELEKLIGFFANTLVLRTSFAGDPPFREVLGRVLAVTRGAYAHQDLPFERLVEDLQPERHMSYAPVFQVMLVLQNAPAAVLDLPGLTLSLLDLDPGTAKFDLLLNVTETPEGGIDGALEYSTDLFDHDRIVRLVGHFTRLLESAGANPEEPVSELDLLTPGERRQILEWNRTSSPSPSPDCVHGPVERWARQTPEAVAAIWAGPDPRAMTYRELNQRANRLARRLLALGVHSDSRVAICLERSLELVEAVLAVLKAGAAYVPIDPDYPAERVKYMLADSGSHVLLTQPEVAARLPETGVRRALLDVELAASSSSSSGDPGFDDSGADDLPLQAGAEHLAYVIYTSGSTGTPKGVAMPHGVLANLFDWQAAESAAGPGSRTLQFASLSFDVSCQEIFSTWWTGGTLVLIPAGLRRDPFALCRVLHEERIERIFLPFVALQQLAEAIAQGAPRPGALREIVTAGEQLQITPAIVNWLSSCEDVRLSNQYGPSEGHVVTAYTLSGNPEIWPALPAIGKPVANVQIHLLDRQLNPVPVGIPGQLHIGGRQVVRGYHGRSELTALKFVPDTQGGEPGARLYATGDLARYLADGNIQYIGRVDEQVKIRGFRVEPGEVESLLARQPEVREAVVVVYGEGVARSLVGYFVCGQPVEPVELRDRLRRLLPDYMVPAILIRLDALPLTPSGKVHRAALPTPVLPGVGETACPPRNALEEIIAGVWMEVLGVPAVDIHTSFFDLGGHSLSATRLVYALRRALGVDLPLRALFTGPTVAELAAGVTAMREGPASTALPVMTRESLAAEAVLDPLISAERSTVPAAPAGACRSVLLTGASGFLGAFLLAELLRQMPAVRVYCLVRASSAEEGAGRLRARLLSFKLWREEFAGRIVPVPGDLAQPALGLGRERFQSLASDIDAIYHNGAWVNLFYAYSTLKPANVLGTEQVLRLAVTGPLKPVHYVSTSGVFFSAGPGPERVDEETSLETITGLIGGYQQSKWVAEKLVRIAGERGVPISIYRPGRIGGHSQTGLGNPDDLLFRILQGSLQLGSVPELDMQVELSPVDFVSGALVWLSRQPGSAGQTFHLLNHRTVPWSRMVEWLRQPGRPVERLSWDDWLRKLHDAAASSADNALYPLLPVLRAGPSLAEEDAGESVAREPRYDCHRTLHSLEGSGWSCPPFDSRLLQLYLARLEREEFAAAES
jgi:amino acid adenylation domain-containing protein/thioester reductase-like protein